MIKTYIFLFGAVICEVAGTMLLPATQNFTKITPSVILAICYMSAFYLLTFVVNKIPIAIVYATWSGLGIFSIAILGYIFFKQTLNWQTVLGKFLGAATILLLMTAGTFVDLIPMYLFAEPETRTIISGYIGFVLLGLAGLAVGQFFSVLTKIK